MKRIVIIKTIVLLIVMVFGFNMLQAQPPIPSGNPKTDAGANGLSGQAGTSTHASPIGTSTALLLAMGAGLIAYNVKKNKKNN